MMQTSRFALALGLLFAAACAGRVDEAPRADAGAGEASPGADGAADGAGEGGPTFGACVRSEDCMVVPASCCGSCGQPTRGDALPIAKAHAADWRAEACQPGQGCPACAGMPDPTLLATCVNGTCTLDDWLGSSANVCATDADCRLRAGACCECGAGTGRDSLVAVPTNGGEQAWGALVCDANATCDGCAPIYPSDARAVCTEGHCAVAWLPN